MRGYSEFIGVTGTSFVNPVTEIVNFFSKGCKRALFLSLNLAYLYYWSFFREKDILIQTLIR